MLDIVLYHIVPFVVILMTLVFVHEFGHYWFARKHGVHVEVFSIGMGPEIFGFNDRHGTRWRVSWFPLGGYVRMLSDSDATSQVDHEALASMSDEDKARALHTKSPWQRIQVSAGGPLANYIFAIIVMALLFFLAGEKLPSQSNQIGLVRSDTPAEAIGLKGGDRIIKMNDHEIKAFEDLVKFAQSRPKETISLTYEREGVVSVADVTLDGREVMEQGQSRMVGVLGVEQSWIYQRAGFFEAWLKSLQKTWNITVLSLHSIVQMITGQKSTKDLMGPLGIARSVAEFAKADVVSLVSVAAFLSISLGFINLLPIPMLDGGHIVMYTIEAARGRPLGVKAQEAIASVGFGVILLLFFVSTWNDIGRFSWVKSLFR